ncbi:MAG: HAMP domain-containing sensor histidine kinase [Verrucomicrobia bacterium]|nr:HAMP domain-containing sensor histidine kinase [Verrucomicrobiota bacterium]
MSESAPLSLTPGQLQARKLAGLVTMAAGIAHDLNNHLAAIQGNNAILLRRLAADAAEYVNAERIDEATTISLQLADKLMVYAGRVGATMEPTNLHELLPAIQAAFQNQHGAETPPITIQVDAACPEIRADAELLTQAVSALLENACEALVDRAGGITVQAAPCDPDTVTPYFDLPRADGPHVLMQVTDAAGGIPMGVRDRIFDPFFTTKIRGSGMGLPTVIGTARIHGGNVFVTHAVTGGTTIGMMLPIEPPDYI